MEPNLAHNREDEVLVGRIVNQDATALDKIHQRYSGVLYSVARQITGNSETAEEVLQDTFFQLWQSAALFDSERGSLLGWLLSIARNRALSRLRAERRAACDASLDVDSVWRNGPTILEREIARQLIVAALDELPLDQRDAIVMAYFEGMSSTEIAARTRMAEGTVKSRLRSGIKLMKRALLNPKPPGRVRAGKARLSDVLITNQLLTRVCRPRDAREQKACLNTLAGVARNTPEKLIDCFLQMGLDLCHAGSAGLSFLECDGEGSGVFRWTHLAGRLRKYAGGTTPRNFSPCGVTLDRDSSQLFRYPGRYFTFFDDIDMPVPEVLVIPFHGDGRASGTVWIASHNRSVNFDYEDARIMTSLTEFIQCGLALSSRTAQSLNPV